MTLNRRRFLATSSLALAALGGCMGAPENVSNETPTPSPTETSSPTEASTPTATSTPTGLDGEITVAGSEWTLDPAAFEAAVDQELTLRFENVGEVTHNLTVGSVPADERSVAEQDEAGTFQTKTETIQPEATTSVTFTPESTGTFPYWCDVPGHREAGMVGELTVVEP